MICVFCCPQVTNFMGFHPLHKPGNKQFNLILYTINGQWSWCFVFAEVHWSPSPSVSRFIKYSRNNLAGFAEVGHSLENTAQKTLFPAGCIWMLISQLLEFVCFWMIADISEIRIRCFHQQCGISSKSRLLADQIALKIVHCIPVREWKCKLYRHNNPRHDNLIPLCKEFTGW